jgi:hypothetical protein
MYGIEGGLVGRCNKNREESAISRLILYQFWGIPIFNHLESFQGKCYASRVLPPKLILMRPLCYSKVEAIGSRTFLAAFVMVKQSGSSFEDEQAD